ncbi:MAG: hypothetical protein R3B49_11655 [Phycisphaerales bacterium]
MGMEAESTAVMDTDERTTQPAATPRLPDAPTPERLDAAVEALLFSAGPPDPRRQAGRGGRGVPVWRGVTAEGVDEAASNASTFYADSGGHSGSKAGRWRAPLDDAA